MEKEKEDESLLKNLRNIRAVRLPGVVGVLTAFRASVFGAESVLSLATGFCEGQKKLGFDITSTLTCSTGLGGGEKS